MKSINQNRSLQLTKKTISKLDNNAHLRVRAGNAEQTLAIDLSIINCDNTNTSCGLYYCDTTYLTR